MVFVKCLKNVAFFKKYQVPKKRRRQGKTDFFARRKMIQQDRNKYNTKKYRIVVRFTNTKCICQIIYATQTGDRVVTSANSTELKAYGIPAGYKNYAAAYCTGLLVARRTLKMFDLEGTFKGVEKASGEDFHIDEQDGDRRPFKCMLDVGLQRTIPGARLWGALKGAVDGGLHIPHNHKNFPGFKKAEGKGGSDSYEAEPHKQRIFGQNVSEYMESLSDEDASKYEAHFSRYIKGGVKPDGLKALYEKAHSAIRAKPDRAARKDKGIKVKTQENGTVTMSDGKTHVRNKKIGLEARKAKVLGKIAAFAGAAAEE